MLATQARAKVARAEAIPCSRRTDAQKALVWQSIPGQLLEGIPQGTTDLMRKTPVIANGVWRSELTPEYQAAVQATDELSQGAPFASFLTNLARAGAASYYSAPGRIAGISDDVVTQGEVAQSFLPDLDNGQWGTVGKLYGKEAQDYPERIVKRDVVPVVAELVGARFGASTKLGREGGFRVGRGGAIEPLGQKFWQAERGNAFRLRGADTGVSPHDVAHKAAEKVAKSVVGEQAPQVPSLLSKGRATTTARPGAGGAASLGGQSVTAGKSRR